MTIRGDVNVTFETTISQQALWIGFAFLLTSSVGFLFLSSIRNVKPSARFFYYIVTVVNAVSALAYLIQALGQSSMYINDENDTVVGVREFEWIRYAQWAITGPLTLICFGLLANVHWTELFFITFAVLIGVASGFAGAVSTAHNATWPLLAYAVAIFAVVAYTLLVSFRASAWKVHPEIGKLYDVLAFGSAFLYGAYVVVWGTSEGGHQTTADQEIVVYTVLDIASKVVFSCVLLFSRESIARHGTFLGAFNSPEINYDFPLAKPATVAA